METFITKIHVNQILHLGDLDILIDEEEKKHLILTGKNGSGKTSLLNSISDFLQIVKDDVSLNFLQIEKSLTFWRVELERRRQIGDEMLSHEAERILESYQDMKTRTFGRARVDIKNVLSITKKLQSGDLIFAFYNARRRVEMLVPKDPEKPNLALPVNIRDTKIGEFLKFMVDLKIQEALAKIGSNSDISDADKINKWFVEFTLLLQDLFEDKDLELVFNYKDYSFKIIHHQKRFGFNELSDGYSAIMDIVVDLVLKMQNSNSLTRVYEKEGIVLIDEIETHLHLTLQRLVLPMLTRIFPNIQFIVTTHSPFVLNSLPNAVAFDLEKKERLENLTEYSYEALAEGYFKVGTESSFLQNKLDRFKELADIVNKDSAELAEFEKLDNEFATMDEALCPQNILGQYFQIKIAIQ